MLLSWNVFVFLRRFADNASPFVGLSIIKSFTFYHVICAGGCTLPIADISTNLVSFLHVVIIEPSGCYHGLLTHRAPAEKVGYKVKNRWLQRLACQSDVQSKYLTRVQSILHLFLSAFNQDHDSSNFFSLRWFKIWLWY